MAVSDLAKDESSQEEIGIVSTTVSYLPFGEVETISAAEGEIGRDEYFYGYTGNETERKVNLIHYHVRYRNPNLTYWLGIDRKRLFKNDIEEGAYTYCRNSPVTNVDRDGNETDEDISSRNFLYTGRGYIAPAVVRRRARWRRKYGPLYSIMRKARTLSGIWGGLGLNTASNFMNHYLSGSGKTKSLNLNRMLREIPKLETEFRGTERVSFSEIRRFIKAQIREGNVGVSAKVHEFRYTRTDVFQQGGKGYYSNLKSYVGMSAALVKDKPALNWFLSLGDFTIKIQGRVTLSRVSTDRGVAVAYTFTYRRIVYDKYDFKKDKGFPLLTNPELDLLSRRGIAREFDISAESETKKHRGLIYLKPGQQEVEPETRQCEK
jgi:RHS repeat-associated protein